MKKTYKFVLGYLLGAAVTMLPRPAHAVIYKALKVTSNYTLPDHVYGSIVIDADNVTLDCNGKQVHISSYSKPNCENNSKKCGILVRNRHNVTIRRCNVVGAFDYGVAVWNTEDTGVEDTTSFGPDVGFSFESNDLAWGEYLQAEDNDSVGLKVGADHGGFYENVTTTATVASAIGTFADHSEDTLFLLFSHRFGDTGFWGNSLLNVGIHYSSFSDTSYRGVGEGIFIASSSGVEVTDTVLEGNVGMGFYIQDTVNSSFLANTAQNNGCDAYQDATSVNTWAFNTFGTICGHVPANH